MHAVVFMPHCSHTDLSSGCGEISTPAGFLQESGLLYVLMIEGPANSLWKKKC